MSYEEFYELRAARDLLCDHCPVFPTGCATCMADTIVREARNYLPNEDGEDIDGEDANI